MANLLNCQAISRSYSGKNLFENVTFGVETGDRIGVIGANGAGKSTLMRILAGHEDTDTGTVTRKKDLSMIYIEQVSVFDHEADVLSALREKVKSQAIVSSDLEGDLKKALSLCGFESFDARVGSLSGGWKKRLAIAACFVGQHDLVLLDEPTNHLDLRGVLWLEQTLKQAPFAWVAISHDRYFLDRTVTKTMELSSIYKHGVLIADTGYSEFLDKRDEYLSEQAAYAESLANKVRREEQWLARGPQARTTKSKSRIDAAHGMQAELATLKKRLETGTTGIEFTSSGRKTKKLITCEGIAKSFSERQIVSDFSLVLTPGTRLGLLGANGSGKSTLLKMMAGILPADAGNVVQADQLRLVYFDQNRDELDPSWSLKRALGEAGDAVIFQGRSIHVTTWAKRFGFNVSQLDIPVSELSGGEQARVLIARLMLTPADVMLLDEPTNDLDIPTLEILEDSLLDFEGAIVLISHDRYLMNRVCNAFVGLSGQGDTQIYADYTQWQRDQTAGDRKPKDQVKGEKAQKVNKPSDAKRLSYMDQREYDRLEGDIEAAEQTLLKAQGELELPEIQSSSAELLAASEALQRAQEEVDRLYSRWDELESKLR